eukprot:SAG31_NODE_644_length_13275_cov_39.464633_3_plen_147_part_00
MAAAAPNRKCHREQESAELHSPHADPTHRQRREADTWLTAQNHSHALRFERELGVGRGEDEADTILQREAEQYEELRERRWFNWPHAPRESAEGCADAMPIGSQGHGPRSLASSLAAPACRPLSRTECRGSARAAGGRRQRRPWTR